MVVPYWSMPQNRVGRLLWIALTTILVLVFAALGIVLFIRVLTGAAEADSAGDAVWQWIVVLLCALGAVVFGWLLADGLRAVAREHAERRRIADQLAAAEARIRGLRGP
jgi:flagellar basal body-associated protein FliL